jgi:branched-chain amino acid transport system ATP-binding protein
LAREPGSLSIANVTVDYGGGPVVHDVSLDVRPGEVVALLGANGAGRTSTIRAACGFAPMASGRVLLGDIDLTKLAPERRSRLGLHLVPEDRGLFPVMTVAQHFRLALRRPPRSGELDGTYELFPRLAQRRKQAAGSLSGGEAQMLSMALALLGEPRVLLVDELSFGLAPNVSRQLLGVCRMVADERGIGVLLVEQFVELALDIADRVAVMSNGVLGFIGSADQAKADEGLLSGAYLGVEDGTPT